MQRTAFIASLATAIGASQCCSAMPALAAKLDEGDLGHQYFLQLREDGDILFDSPYYEHLNEVGEVIANVVKDRYPYPIRYYIVRGDSANAFSVPGGNIYVNEPLLRLAKNRDELGGVLAHETGHMVLHHVAKGIKGRQTTGTVAQVGSILANILLGPLGGYAAGYAANTAANAQDLNISRHIEAEADEEGARIAAATNYLNPYGLIWFFQTMTAVYGTKGAFWQRSHPFDQARVADLETLFAKNPDVFGKFKDTKQRDVAYWT
jgi:predicted Zn-dependent protease